MYTIINILLLWHSSLKLWKWSTHYDVNGQFNRLLKLIQRLNYFLSVSTHKIKSTHLHIHSRAISSLPVRSRCTIAQVIKVSLIEKKKSSYMKLVTANFVDYLELSGQFIRKETQLSFSNISLALKLFCSFILERRQTCQHLISSELNNSNQNNKDR